MARMQATKDLFLRSMSAIYLFAFASLYVQIPGLYGDNGILPAKVVLKPDGRPPEKRFQGRPSLMWLLPGLGLDAQEGMDLICILGCLLAVIGLTSRRMRDSVLFALLWFLYLSVYEVGQTFLWFQWDILLLEAGFLTILVAPLHLRKWRPPQASQHDTITLWLVRWLLFRLMFASGVVKLTSRCPTWWGLTALDWHYESQCIPTPLAWYAHQLPQWFQKLSVAAVYLIECFTPFLFFVPIRNLRLFSWFSQILLQVLIVLTGNYNFFNLLTVTLCIPLLDDQFLGKNKPAIKSDSFAARVGRGLAKLVSFTVYAGLAYSTVRLFNLRINAENYSVESEIAFTDEDFFNGLRDIMPYTIWLGKISLGAEVLMALWRSISQEQGILAKVWSSCQCFVFTSVAIYMFTISLVPHCMVDQTASANLSPEVRQLHHNVQSFNLVHSYGLFRRMTGVGGRPEVVVEGSNDLNKGWKAYEFLYKPGNVSVSPPFVAPHQPRLDWQMWFAALGSYERTPWFINFAYRLLEGKPEVLDLIASNPFPEKPPKFIRANLYTYRYTSFRSGSPSWWKRKLEREYMPAISKETKGLKEHLQRNGIIQESSRKKAKSKTQEPQDNTLKNLLAHARSFFGVLTGPTLIFSLFLPAVVISIAI
ncbi:lipase maturation factor 2-like [Patiria miniata]|uniref:Lipase maturation factor n=1 Tax=Patiria miniata TaxID=46514 RepID=A0A913Z834_PATMI|nr:lipase maturation factor 2-like [Patiria miniata]XP_038047015.1 lipase maturation factor 2-like [Patiria miniata]